MLPYFLELVKHGGVGAAAFTGHVLWTTETLLETKFEDEAISFPLLSAESIVETGLGTETLYP